MELINVNDFIEHLKRNDLVIVSRKDLGIDQRIEIDLVRERIRKRGFGTLQEMVDAKFFTVKTLHGLKHWIKSGKIREDEIYRNRKGKIHILYEAVELINKR